MSRLPPLEPPYEPDVEERLSAMMPPGVPPILLFRTFARNLPMAAAMDGWGRYELTKRLSLTMLLAATLFAHDSAAFRVHAAAGLGGDGCRCASCSGRPCGSWLMGPAWPGQCQGVCTSGAGRSGLWLPAWCCGPGASDPRGDGQDRAG